MEPMSGAHALRTVPTSLQQGTYDNIDLNGSSKKSWKKLINKNYLQKRWAICKFLKACRDKKDGRKRHNYNVPPTQQSQGGLNPLKNSAQTMHRR